MVKDEGGWVWDTSVVFSQARSFACGCVLEGSHLVNTPNFVINMNSDTQRSRRGPGVSTSGCFTWKIKEKMSSFF